MPEIGRETWFDAISLLDDTIIDKRGKKIDK